MILNMGGGSPLNFRVVGGTTQPANPAENTIWVNTDVNITGWAFTNEEITEPYEGMVRFPVGNNSKVSFNAVGGEKIIRVYPVSCMQYVNGAWTAVIAKTYQNGEWLEWALYLYKYGDTCADVTGEYTNVGKQLASGSDNGGQAKMAVSYNADNVKLVQSGNNGCGIWYTTNAIDLTGYSTLCVEVDCAGMNKFCRAQVWGGIGSYATSNVAAYTEFADGASVTKVQISELNGKYHVGIMLFKYAGVTNATVTIRSMWLE